MITNAKRVSIDEKNAIEFDFFSSKPSELKISISDVLCIYDNKYWIGLVNELNSEQHDVHVKFMHPHYPARSYKWPVRDDECWVADTDILCTLKALTTATGR